MNRGAWQATVHGVARDRHDLATKPAPPMYLSFHIITLFQSDSYLYYLVIDICLD